jgi:transcriptional regulator with XRE-family HTH domain
LSIDTVGGLYHALGKAIAAKRRTKGMSQAALGTHVGLTRASIANIETGRQKVLLHYVYLAAAALECSSITELLPEISLESLHYEPDEELVMGDDVGIEERMHIERVLQDGLRDRRTP